VSDPDLLDREYASEERLARRRLDFWGELEGDNPWEVTAAALAELRPRRILDVGCGSGELAQFVADAAGATVVAVDRSARMVELARERGLEAQVADVQALPFSDGEFDAVLAAWMLYHVADLELGLTQIARVLRPGGRLVAVANDERHMEELWSLVGGDDTDTTFQAGNGQRALERHFGHVERRDALGTVVFPDRAAVVGYLDAFDVLASESLAGRLPAISEPFRVTRHNVVLVADKAAA